MGVGVLIWASPTAGRPGDLGWDASPPPFLICSPLPLGFCSAATSSARLLLTPHLLETPHTFLPLSGLCSSFCQANSHLQVPC